MTTENRSGCAAWFASLFGITLKATHPVEPVIQTAPELLPYRLRDDFLSPAELNFYRILRQTIGDTAVICLKVSLGDLFYPKSGSRSDNRIYRNKINRKHIDFLLCDPQSMHPIIGIELDDASHQRTARQERDYFVGQVFDAAGIPLLRQPVRSTYNTRELAAQMADLAGLDLQPKSVSNVQVQTASTRTVSPQQHTKSRQFEHTAPEITLPDGEVPACPKCGQPMALRTVKKAGPHYGNQFWGCPDFPHCRGVRKYE